MLIHPWDDVRDEAEWRDFVRTEGFGHLVAAGRGRDVPVVIPTQYLLDDMAETPTVLLHLARPNPVWRAIEENPLVLLSVAGDWAYIPSEWKVVRDEDPSQAVPTTYYAAVQLTARAHVLDSAQDKIAVLRRQLDDLQPGGPLDPADQARLLPGIRALRLEVTDVRAKFKYGGNVDGDHRSAVAERLARRGRPADLAARGHLLRRSR